MCVGNPTVNSYCRMWDTGFWAPIYKNWGWQNRTTTVRVASGGRFEYRGVDSACNPYLTVAALLQAGLDGIRNASDPGEPQTGNTYELLEAGEEIEKVPDSLGAALDALDADEVVKSAMPGRLYEVFATTSATSGSATWRPSPTGSATSTWKSCRDLRRSADMCGIAGLIYKNGSTSIGDDMARMLQSMKHRGPDSTGLRALPAAVGRLGHARQARRRQHGARLRVRPAHRAQPRRGPPAAGGGGCAGARDARASPHAMTVTFSYDGDDLKPLADRVEDIHGTEVLSLGHTLEIVKDIGDAQTVADEYGLQKFQGTHGIGHVRMATESDVDISGAHPYWAYPFSDVAVVHNGQLTNYHQWRRRLERAGHRFQSECDSEIIAVYLAERMDDGDSLEDAMHRSLDELDGVFTYLAVTGDELGMAKDELAAKPLVLYEGDDVVALASEEIAIRAVLDREIDTYDPYESEVMVWSR